MEANTTEKENKLLVIIKKVFVYVFGSILIAFLLWGIYDSIFHKEKVIFKGPDIIVNYKNQGDIRYLNNNDIIDLENFEGKLYVILEWEYLFKYFRDEKDLPEIKYLDKQGIIYRLYLDDELISTNYNPDINEYYVAQIRNNNGIFRWESKTGNKTLFDFKINQSGFYKIVCEVKILIDGIEEIYIKEFNFQVKET